MAASGTWSNGTWYYSNSNVLTISGTGAMDDSEVPWADCLATVTHIVVNYGVTTIMDYAFTEAYNVVSITLPSSITKIGKYAFAYVGNIGEATIKLVLHEGVTEIDDYAFLNFGYLHGITLPSSLTSIGKCAFSGCGRLSGIELPENLLTISDSAFEDSGLTSIHIPASVEVIGKSAFSNSRLETITVDALNVNFCAVDDVLFNSDCTELLQYPNMKKETSYVVPDGVITLGSGCFVYSWYLETINLPNSLKKICDSALKSCPNLTFVEIPSGVTEIEEAAFAFCDSLESVNLPYGITYIGALLFNSCDNLQEITIPETVTVIKRFAFNSCASLTEVTIPNSVTEIGNQAFYKCTSLSKVTIGKGVTTIGIAAFMECPKLDSLTLPVSVTNIGYNAFLDSGLSELILLARTPPTIGSDMFGRDLSKIVVPYGCGETYKTAEGWIEYEAYIVEGSPYDLKSFLIGYALGLAGKPLPFAKKTPIGYSYNGTVLPEEQEDDTDG